MHNSRYRSVFCLVVAAISITSALMAQSPGDSVFGERIEVRVVNVEVVVTDRQGQRVSGLGADDFYLEVDGEALAVDFFSEIAEGRRVESVGLMQESATPEASEPLLNPTGAAPGGAVGTSYLVFIDNFFAPRARDRNQVLRGIQEQVAELGANDRMALVSFNGRRLQMLSNWSNSTGQLNAAFDAATGQGATGLRTSAAVSELDALTGFDTADAESSQGPAGPAELQGDGTFSAASPEARAASAMEQIESQIDRVVLGVTATMRSFAQAPGRKVMLVLSGGWPMSVCDYLLGPRDPIRSSGECINRGPEIYKPIYDMANLLGFTLYPIDVPTSRMDVDASENDLIALARNGPGVSGSQAQPVSNTFREAELHTTLRKLANETGGLPMINEARRTSLEQVIEDTRSYYWLGFTPQWQGNDRSRKIKIRVNRPGLDVRYREGFKDLSRAKEVDFMVESTLLFGPLPGMGMLGVRLGDIPQRGRKVNVPIELIIPMDSITMLPHQGRYVAELELRIAALDEYGDRNEIAAVPVKLDGDQPPPKGAHAVYALDIKIKRQPQDLVVSLYDPVGDRMLVAKDEFKP